MLVKMKEILMIEGRGGTNVLESFLDCDTIETNGTHLGKEILRQIGLAQKTRGAITSADPDFPGEKIRPCVNAAVPGCRNTFTDKAKARTGKKVGVEHACRKDILEALTHLMIFGKHLRAILSCGEYLDPGLNGREGSAEERAQTARSLHLGKPNVKTLLKCLDMLQLHKTNTEKLLGQPYE